MRKATCSKCKRQTVFAQDSVPDSKVVCADCFDKPRKGKKGVRG